MRGSPLAVALTCLAGVLAACGGGGGGSAAPALAPTTTPLPVTQPVNSQGTLTVALNGDGYVGSLTLTGVTSTITAGVTATVTLQTTPLAGFPTLQSLLRRDARSTAALNLVGTPLYLELIFSGTIGATGGTLMLSVPATQLVANATYDVALFDPNVLSLGWQLTWAGPATPNAGTLSFTLPAPLGFNGMTTYGFALYAVGAPSTPTPTPAPAPSASASAAPTTSPAPAPTITPSALNANPTTVQIPAPGASNAQPLLIGETGYSGTFTESDSCGGTTPIATFSASSGSGPSWTLNVTGVNAGTCVATFRDANAQSVTVSVVVTSNGFTIDALPRKGP